LAKGQLAELRLWSIETTLLYQPNRAAFLRFLLGHDFFIGNARLWLAERAKSRGSHGGAPETGFKGRREGWNTTSFVLQLAVSRRALNPAVQRPPEK